MNTRVKVKMDTAATHLWMDYLSKVRQALSSLDDAEIREIVDELDNHLESEVSGKERELNEQQIKNIVARLGLPEEIAENAGIEKPQVIAHPSSITFFLAYVSLFVLLAGLLMPGLSLVLVLVAGVLARVSIQQEAIFATPVRWVVMPPLTAIYILVGIVVFLWPMTLVIPVAATGGFLESLLMNLEVGRVANTFQYWLVAWSTGVLLSGIWHCLLALSNEKVDRIATLLFFPFWRSDPSAIKRRFLTTGVLMSAGSVVFTISIL